MNLNRSYRLLKVILKSLKFFSCHDNFHVESMMTTFILLVLFASCDCYLIDKRH